MNVEKLIWQTQEVIMTELRIVLDSRTKTFLHLPKLNQFHTDKQSLKMFLQNFTT